MPRKVKLDQKFDAEKADHILDVEQFACQCMEAFFRNKKNFIGKSILNSELYSRLNLDIVIKTKFDDETFKFIHENCLTIFPQEKWYKDTTVPWTVYVLLELINELKSLRVPKELQTGMLLVYFKLCHGIKLQF